jgi:cell division protein FtsW (lipid II flippase)
MVPFALGGMALFAIALLVVWLAGAPAYWLWTCAAGVLWGIPGLLTMLRHDANRRRRRALSHPEFQVHA